MAVNLKTLDLSPLSEFLLGTDWFRLKVLRKLRAAFRARHHETKPPLLDSFRVCDAQQERQQSRRRQPQGAPGDFRKRKLPRRPYLAGKCCSNLLDNQVL